MITTILLWIAMLTLWSCIGLALAVAINLHLMMIRLPITGTVMFMVCGPAIWFVFFFFHYIDSKLIQPKWEQEDAHRAAHIYDR